MRDMLNCVLTITSCVESIDTISYKPVELRGAGRLNSTSTAFPFLRGQGGGHVRFCYMIGTDDPTRPTINDDGKEKRARDERVLTPSIIRLLA